MDLVVGAARWEVASSNGSRGPVVCGSGRSSRGVAATIYYEETRVAAGGPALSTFNESEGDNADAIGHGSVESHILMVSRRL